MFGYTSAELIGESVDVLVPNASRTAHVGLRQGYLRHPQSRNMGAGREIFGRRKDGSEVSIEVRLTPVSLGETRFVVASVVVVVASVVVVTTGVTTTDAVAVVVTAPDLANTSFCFASG